MGQGGCRCGVKAGKHENVPILDGRVVCQRGGVGGRQAQKMCPSAPGTFFELWCSGVDGGAARVE